MGEMMGSKLSVRAPCKNNSNERENFRSQYGSCPEKKQVVSMARENETDTDNNGADEVRQDRLWFLDGMDRINCALQGTDDFEQMGDVLNAVLSIFRCDRAWIVSPCDPESRTWRTVAERAAPKFAEVGLLGLDLPMDAEVAHVHRVIAASKTAERFGPEANNPIPSGIAERFGVQSQLCVAI
jgi:hypothetical protein